MQLPEQLRLIGHQAVWMKHAKGADTVSFGFFHIVEEPT